MQLLRIALIPFVFLSCWAQEIQLVPVASGLDFPTDIQSPPDGTGRLFVLQRNGLIRIVQNGSVLPQPFLDLRSKTRGDGEQGLLGMAFSPNYRSTGRFYINYTDLNGDTHIAMFQVSGDPNVADPNSEQLLLFVDQPFNNHNGGGMVFGPDGLLYIGLGDGGSAGDPFNNAQSLTVVFGKMLRVDVESNPGQLRIPADNPFVNRAGARGEIWAYGLRNPWRYSFDRATGDLWIADVGQLLFEEINYQPAGIGGQNYGWRITEGLHCYNASSCNTEGITFPVAEYDHDSGCSVTGGFVYRGTASPGLRGTYIYADFCTGAMWGLERNGGEWANRLLVDTNFLITTFGQGQDGELYVADARGGAIYRIQGSSAPAFTAADVVNPASFESGLVAGSLATIFVHGVRDTEGTTAAPGVPLPLDLDGVSVLVNGSPVPVHAVANVSGTEQVNFQAPFSLTPGATANVVVRRGAAVSPEVSIPVQSLQPAVFTSNGSAVVVHGNYQIVTPENPLREGEVAFLYAVGLGGVSNAPSAGAAGPVSPLAATVSPVRVSIGGTPAEVPFAGLAPGLVGVYQVNFRVPASIPSGSLPLVVGIGTEDSPPVQTLVE